MSSKLTFIKSAVDIHDFPEDNQSEILFAGRSNAGKSSLINTIAQGKVAKVSSTPGKTRHLNIFEHREGYRIIDMPGYGYAIRSKDEVDSWKKMIEPYLLKRMNIKGLVLVMDIRREWAEEEQQMLELAQYLRVGLAVILNKADKLSRGAALAKKAKLSQSLSINDCLLMSVLKKQGIEDLENLLIKWK
ncbi:MAG: ribosome biogenesis GTP-binding protein YihA/YsxC [Bdellovibrionales bacterium]|nr:ribosome biogenesis GTP-binding protein YihA/YsxC [Bdellovibrionales bacterium]